MYIYTDNKLLQERRVADPIIWYINQPFFEDSDPNVDPFDREDRGVDGGDDGNESGDDGDNDGGDNSGEELEMT